MIWVVLDFCEDVLLVVMFVVVSDVFYIVVVLVGVSYM